MTEILNSRIASIRLPAMLVGFFTLGLVAVQARILCDVVCLHGQDHLVRGDICHG
ncbi:hypothetical protein VQ042_19500 [Aurantimonas sp. A2-1-M11]|uniref:hypothetical protein n=1 Tax=Aurantimonas sp. A2-1-M11 TaxID=3113712 RepID=UPI002F920734